MPTSSNHCKLTLNNFKLEAETILNELTAYHLSKQRLIEHTFQKLFDNLPASIKDLPINECMNDYVKILKELKENKNKHANEKEGEIIDESIFTGDEDMDDHNQGSATNLTSTVKKLNPRKLELHKKHLDHIINEQSVIHETLESNACSGNNNNNNNNDDTLNADDNKIKSVQFAKNEACVKNNDYKCKIIYFFKNCSQAIANLEDLENINTSLIHEDSAKGIERIRQALSLLN